MRLFGARFRENAARALLIPRARPGKRTPLWQQRLKSQSLLEVAKKYGEFPIILETYRECLRDVLDVPGLVELLTALHRRELTLVEVETATASPFASSLLFDYVATYMYEGDTPNAERRAAALSLDRDLLRELLGQEELRDLIDPGALEQVEDDLQFRSDMRQATGRDGLHDVLRGVGDLTVVGGAAAGGRRARRSRDARRAAARAAGVAVRLAGEERWIDAADAGLYRDALGAAPPGRAAGGVPRGRARRAVAPGPPLRRDARPVHGRRAARALRRRLRRRARRRSSAAESSSGESCGPAAASASGATPRCCGACAAPRSPCCARRSSRSTRARSRASCPAWQGVDRHPATGAGVDRLREVLVSLQGLALPAEVWERDVLPRRAGAYSPAWIDQLCASGELVWIGAGALGRSSGRVALYFREDLPVLGPPPARGAVPESEHHAGCRERLAAGACFFTDLLVDVDLAPEELQEALWDLAWAGRGDQRRVRAAAGAAADAGPGPARAGPERRPSGAVRGAPARRGRLGAGPGTLVADRAAVPRARSIRRRGGERWRS